MYIWLPKALLFARGGVSSFACEAGPAVDKSGACSQDALGPRGIRPGPFRGNVELSAAETAFSNSVVAGDTCTSGPSAGNVAYLLHRAARCSDVTLISEMYAGIADTVIDGRAFSRAEIAAARSAINDLFSFVSARGSSGSGRAGCTAAA